MQTHFCVHALIRFQVVVVSYVDMKAEFSKYSNCYSRQTFDQLHNPTFQVPRLHPK